MIAKYKKLTFGWLQLALLNGVLILVISQAHIVQAARQAKLIESAARLPVAAAPRAEVSKKNITGIPTVLSLPTLNINLAVQPGDYDASTATWTLSDSTVQYMVDASLPSSNTGNTIIYGHNTMAVLARTAELNYGDQVIVKSSNNHNFYYTYVASQLVSPNDTSILSLKPTNPQLTLITCNGFWNEYRKLMYFNFLKVE